MKEQVIPAYDGTAEWIVPVKVAADADEEPKILYRDEPLTKEGMDALPEYEKRILELTLADLSETPTFDGAHIYCARGHFYVSKPAKRLEASSNDTGLNAEEEKE